MNITGMEDDDELDDDLSPQVLQQSQDSEQFLRIELLRDWVVGSAEDASDDSDKVEEQRK